MTRPDDFDAVVIGGGSAGLAFARRAAERGARVALVEESELGGTCVNRGCVPKKLLWHVARTRREEEALAESGHLLNVPRLDLGHVQDTIERHIEGIRQSYAQSLEDAGVHQVRARARVSGTRTVLCGDRRISTDRIVIATGSSPVRAQVPGADLTEVSCDVFRWREVPERLLIVGGGYIGVEFATIFSGFGTAVTLADEGEAVLDGFDQDAIEYVRRHLEGEGVRFEMGTRLSRVERSDGALLAHFDDGGTVPCDRVIVATGREPRAAGLGEVIGTLERADSGALMIDERFGTSREGIFAVGDAADRMPLTPVAKRDGEWLAEDMFGSDAGERLDLGLVATVTYSDPPVAQVGKIDDSSLSLTKAEVSPLQDGLASNGAEHAYFYKLLTDGEDGPLRGATFVSRTAANEISWAAAAIAGGLERRAMALPASVHPSFTEEYIG